MKIKKQLHRGPYIRNRKNASGDSAYGPYASGYATGDISSNKGGGDFWSNFANITGSLGGLFSNIAGGWAQITTAQNTTTENKNNSASTGLYFGIGIVVLVIVLILIVVLVRKPN